MTALVYSAAFITLAWGMARKWRHNRPDAVMAALFGFTIASMVLGSIFAMPRLAPMLAAMDGAMVVAMALIWTRFHSQRARCVGSIGLAKVAWALTAWGYPAINWNSYAAALNAAFFAQAIVAGGFCDGVGRWIADLHRGILDRARSGFGHVV